MKKRLQVFTCILAISVLMSACGSTETTDSFSTETQVATTTVSDSGVDANEVKPTATPTPTDAPTNTPAPTPLPECEKHDFEVIKVKSTCVEKGSYTETCKVCGYSETRELNLSRNHTPSDEWSIELEATNESAGIVYKECSLCKILLDKVGYKLVNGEMQVFTWRQTTDEKNLYWTAEERANAGQQYMGEDFDEILQMMEDPSITFNEKHFFDGSVFEGCVREQIEFFVANGYTLDSLLDELSETKFISVFDYFESIGKPLK